VPLTINNGPDKGRGAVDRMLPLLTAALPEYDHAIMQVNRARAMQMLNEPGLTCDPTLLWTAERAKTILYSVPSMNTISNGVVIQRRDQPLFSPFITNGAIDLQALLASGVTRVGMVAERSYGVVIDKILGEAPPAQLLQHHGNNAVGSLLRMERLGRIKAVLGYLPETRYHAQEEGLDPEQLQYLPVAGAAKYQYIYVGCSDTAASRAVLEKVNESLRKLRAGELIGFYAQWLDPVSRTQYVRDSAAFFNANRDAELNSQR
jgi:uncharacterized protein (TIGR02285 family)